jgi:hypothetical protein
MFSRVCQTLASPSRDSLPPLYLTDNTVIHITPSLDTLPSSDNIFTPSIDPKSPLLCAVQRLPVDGIDTSYRRHLIETPPPPPPFPPPPPLEERNEKEKGKEIEERKQKKKKNDKQSKPINTKQKSPIVTVKKTSPLALGDLYLEKHHDEVEIIPRTTLLSYLSPGGESHSSRNSSSGNTKGGKSIFNYTEIEQLEEEDNKAEEESGGIGNDDEGEDQSISLTIDGTIETLEILEEDDQIEDEEDMRNQNEIEGSDEKFHQRDYLVNQLFHERKLSLHSSQSPTQQKKNEFTNGENLLHVNEEEEEEVTEVSSSLLIGLKSSHDANLSINRTRNGIYFYHPPIDSFRKLSSPSSIPQSPPLPPPPPPSSSPPPLSVPLTPVNDMREQKRERREYQTMTMMIPQEESSLTHDDHPLLQEKILSSRISFSQKTNSGLRTTPTTPQSLQFRQYYENFRKERQNK